MKIKLINEKLGDIISLETKKWLSKYFKLDEDILFGLDKNSSYVVQAIAFIDSHPFFYVFDEDDSYPTPYPAMLFEIIDPRLSNYWKLGYNGDGETGFSIIAFEEWASDPVFYERLVDEWPTELEVMRSRRKLIDEEFEKNP